MHLTADGGREGLVCYSFLNRLLSKTDRIYDTLHLAHLFLAQIHFLAGDVFVVSEVGLRVLAHLLLCVAVHLLILTSILSYDIAIIFSKLATKIIYKVSLLVGEDNAWVLLRNQALMPLF